MKRDPIETSSDSDAARDRKAEHLQLAADRGMQGTGGVFERYRFEHVALPEIDYQEIDLTTSFLGRSLRYPLLVSCMTGGTAEAATINENLALAAERCGIALGVGSQRKALESPETAVSFEVRELAPNVPLLANLGAVQLNYGYGPDQCQQVVDMIEADALVLHLNPLQEAIQPEGDLRFAHLLPRIAEVVDRLTVPVVVKEIGCGISGKIARQLQAIGVEWIDTAGAGGTSWARIEAARADEPTLGELFSDWGIETPESIRQVRSVAGIRVIASGGVRNGIDVAKCLALGAELVGMAYPFLTAARISADEVERVVASMVRQLEIAMFCVGAKNRQALQQAPMTLDGRLLLSGR